MPASVVPKVEPKAVQRRVGEVNPHVRLKPGAWGCETEKLATQSAEVFAPTDVGLGAAPSDH
jgi:hypothetical protein